MFGIVVVIVLFSDRLESVTFSLFVTESKLAGTLIKVVNLVFFKLEQ